MYSNSPDDTSKIKTYIGDDGNIHFVDRTGADTVLPFNNSSNSLIGECFILTGYNGSTYSVQGIYTIQNIKQYKYIFNVFTLYDAFNLNTTDGNYVGIIKNTLSETNTSVVINSITIKYIDENKVQVVNRVGYQHIVFAK